MSTYFHRRSIRLKDFDYSQPGAYFITLLAWQRENLFGQLAKSGDINLSPIGDIISVEWVRLEKRFRALELDEWVIMPNHLHGIIFLTESSKGTEENCNSQAQSGSPVPLPAVERYGVPVRGSIPTIIRSFKSSVTQQVQRMVDRQEVQRARHAGINDSATSAGAFSFLEKVWHRNYYEHVIRDEIELDFIRLYIKDNPRRWAEDDENPEK